MIASLRGRIAQRGVDHVVLDVAGVGYKVFVPRQPEPDDVHLHVHHVVREDGQFLYGFTSGDELTLFELLISVSGVGPRAALSLLSVARAPDLAAAIASGDVGVLARAPGVGKKTAERIVVDLRAKVARVAGELQGAPVAVEDDAVAALLALGYTAAEAAAALRGVPGAGAAPTEDRVAQALRKAVRVV